MSGKILISQGAIASIQTLPIPAQVLHHFLTSEAVYKQLKSGRAKVVPIEGVSRSVATYGLIRGPFDKTRAVRSISVPLIGALWGGVKSTIVLRIFFQRVPGGMFNILMVTADGSMIGRDQRERPSVAGAFRPLLDDESASGRYALPKRSVSPFPRADFLSGFDKLAGEQSGLRQGEGESADAWRQFKVKSSSKPSIGPPGTTWSPDTPATKPPSKADRPFGPPAVVAPKSKPAAGLDGDEVQLWYGTNRKPISPASGQVRFGTVPDEVVHYGRCRVWIDGKRPKGGFYRFWDRIKQTLGKKDVVLGKVLRMDAERFWTSLQTTLAIPDRRKSLLLFVHGFCNTFADAARTAAVLARDACHGHSEVAFFSWPSFGSPGKYVPDIARTEASEELFLDFFRSLLTGSGAETVHVVAHSMGGRLVARTLEKMQTERDRAMKLETLIFASPDVERTMFLRINKEAGVSIARRVLYVSDRDTALKKSRWPLINDSPRAGLRPPWTVAENIETIDVSEVDLSSNGHRALREAPAVLDDMFRLTTAPANPPLRGLHEAELVDGIQTWKFKEERR